MHIIMDQEIEVLPEILALEFLKMDASEQARFFNACAEKSKDWLPMQLQAITDDEGLTLAGRNVMAAIGEYSHWGVMAKERMGMNDWMQENWREK